jgi:formate C-acetyltransferase/4-hydroxyphenylacetate decarboxylase large subunit
MSHGIVQPGFINHGKLLDIAMNGGVDPVQGVTFRKTALPNSMQELKGVYLDHLAECVRNWQVYWNYTMPAHRNTVNLIYASALTRDCLSSGLSLDDGGAINNSSITTLSSGMVNVVNSLAAVEYLLDKKLCTMEELRAALKANWKGYEKLHKAAMEAPKWGNNDDRVDKLYVELFEQYCNLVKRQTNYLGEKYDPSMLAISTHGTFLIQFQFY